MSDEAPPMNIRSLTADREEWPYAVIGYHFKDLDAAKAHAKALRSFVVVRATGEQITP